MRGCSSPTTGARPITSRLAKALGLGLALTLIAAAAPARADVTPLVGQGEGVTAPAGLVGTPDGALWVSDAEQGVCRVDVTPADPLQLPPNRLLPSSDYCGPGTGNENAPASVNRPSGTAQLAFRADTDSAGVPADAQIGGYFYVAEGTSKGSGVWRMRYDGATLGITSAERIVNTNGSRVSALALSADGTALYYNGGDDNVIRRVDAPTAAAVGGPTEVVGRALDPGVVQMAELGGDLYLAESGAVADGAPAGPGGISVLRAGQPNAVPILGVDGTPTAIAADRARGIVFIGAGTRGADSVFAYSAGGGIGAGGGIELYEPGFSVITGLGLRADNTLLVGSNPGADTATPQGKIDTVAPVDPNRPRVEFTSTPAVYTSASSVSFAFTSNRPPAEVETFMCQVDGADWLDCGSGTKDILDLAVGGHDLAVQAVPFAGSAGPVARYSFFVDRTAPVVTVDNPAADRSSERESLRLRFSADDFGTRFACRLDDAAWKVCESPRDIAGYAVGEHRFEVRGTNQAGDTSATTAWTFTRRPRAVIVAAQPVPAPFAAPQQLPGTGPAAAPAPATRTTCRTVAAPKAQGRYTISGRRLAATVTPPRAARYLKVTLRKLSGRGPAAVAVVTKKLGTAGRALSLPSTLSPGNAGRLRSGRYRLAVSYGTCPSLFGAPSLLTKKGARP